MQRNQWNTASQQLLRHWQRSGISQIPVTSAQTVGNAEAWLKENAATIFAQPIAVGSKPSEPSQSGFPSVVKENPPPNPAAMPAISPPKPTVQPSKPLSPAANPVAPKKPIESVPSLGQQGMWATNSLSLPNRTEVLKSLNEEVNACRKCEDIVCRRQRTVFGVGALNARVVMFGEAPGADEDRVGEPFVGAAGQLLDKILVASGLKRPEVYILNALKCRPPGNRTPTDIEIENCRPYFESQLETIQPEYIVCWGSVAVRAVLKSTESVGRLRGKFHAYRGAKVMVTYHPAYLLRTPDAKRLTWEDMKMLMKDMGIPISGNSS